MNVFGIGLPELAVIAAIGLLVFGPKRLPELGRTLGRTLKGFQSASREFEQEFRQAIDTETVNVTKVDRAIPVASMLPTPGASVNDPPAAGEPELLSGDPEQGSAAGPPNLPSS
ncbi:MULTISPECIES: TatA/E family twin arginine-targeting protein translocase [unclassified Synechococcus]|uniref:TatA/E family twin arginine-targeting protein translocase n=1 Tax=unclassified Synechococcus TaxID=2626047 RepID=UPI0020CCB17B|nr:MULTISPECIES: TatA/E family twin arginine-targeting protein translocase [unclassified Synechococcus]